jgi:hypothetical protein
MNYINLTSGKKSAKQLGAALLEYLVSVGVGSVALASLMFVFVSSNRSFIAIGNYVNLDQKSRLAVEQMTRDIRNSQNLTSFATNQLVFTYSGTTNLTYLYDPVARTLTSWKTGGTTNTLLTGCDFFSFSMYNNIPSPGGVLSNTVAVASGKAVSAAWRCSRTILGAKVNTENMQEALIVIRNKPVS